MFFVMFLWKFQVYKKPFIFMKNSNMRSKTNQVQMKTRFTMFLTKFQMQITFHLEVVWWNQLYEKESMFHEDSKIGNYLIKSLN